MRGKRTDLAKQADIIEGLVNGKLGSDIAKDVGVHESTVSRIKDTKLQDVASESEKIAELVDRNDRLQSLADKMIEQKILSGEEVIKISELVSLRQSTFTQNQLITGKSTENNKIEIIFKE